MAEDLVLKILKEMRAEAKESRKDTRDNFSKVFHRFAADGAEARGFRSETRDNFGKVFHRLAVLETQMGDVRTRMGSLERHMAALEARMQS